MKGQNLDQYRRALEEKKAARYCCNLTLQDRIYFLCKFKEQSYWRCKWISMRRMLAIGSQMLVAQNLQSPFQVYYGMLKEFGVNAAINIQQISK